MSEEKMSTSVRMVFLSNLLESKGIWDLLDALVLLKQRGYLLICNIVGAETAEINKEKLFMEISKRGLDEVAIYKGCIYGDDKSKELDDADIFVFPTYYQNECFPLVLLEAMAHGLPCVATNEGAITDIVEDGVTGFIAKKNCPEDLANKISCLLRNDSLRQQMGIAGRNKYENKFTLERFEQNFVNCLNAVLADSK